MIDKFGNKKIVILIGAGSTLDNTDSMNDYEKPPLDRNFFQKTYAFLKKSKIDSVKRKEMLYEFEYVRAYFEIWYGIDIFSAEDDRLEKVMSQIFTDVKNKERLAFPVFLAFMKLLYDILGETTNNMGIDNEKPLFRIIDRYIKKGVKPENLTIISFNYDIYVEKILAALARTPHYPDNLIFLLQHCYELDLNVYNFTSGKSPRIGWFPVRLDIKKGGVRVLKLHGSLNWYSIFPSKNVSLKSMFKRNRLLKVSRESEINSNKMKYANHEGLFYTIPIIVPPINNKSEYYHSKILKLWKLAKVAISGADELLIYGYSCPSLDTESEKLLKQSIGRNNKIRKISVIDPNPVVCDRYIQIFNPKKILWYQNSAYFY